MNSRVGPSPARFGERARRQVATARIQLAMTAALVFSIVVAATAVSVGVARAQGQSATAYPDAGLVLALMLVAAGIMGGLSAIAVRLAGRPRQR